ncbi:hypothetical protein VTO42DRAFT_7705 [Malbranchea cinnamomea]
MLFVSCLRALAGNQSLSGFWRFVLASSLSFFGGAILLAAGDDRPLPISIPHGHEWIGYDGNWSPVTVRVGTPPQWVNLLPNTLTSETWVIGREGCDGSMTCRTKRGGLFLANESSTWADVGDYEMGYTVQLENDEFAHYGYDTIRVDDKISAANQIVAIYNHSNWWIGSLGLGVKRSNFTEGDILSFLSSLVNGSHIPSHSYGYTAGAYNRLKKVPGSLTFGGFDKSRFVPNNISFDLSPDYQPVVAIQSIEISSTLVHNPMSAGNDSGLVPSDNDYLFTIDSSTPFFWFPEKMCDSFASALGLTYNETLQLYTYGSNPSRFDSFVDSAMKFTFTLSNLPDSTKHVVIELPISSMDHRLTYPFPDLSLQPSDEGLRYFPLRKAKDPRQYTIGRTFLQEAYLVVDYERRNFSISQAIFEQDGLNDMDLVAIPAYSEKSSDPEGSTLSSAAKTGIGVGATTLAVLLGFTIYLWIHRRRQNNSNNGEKNPEKKFSGRIWWRFWRRPASGPPVSELPADKRFPTEAPADASATRFELPGAQPAELPGSCPEYLYFESKGNETREIDSYKDYLLSASMTINQIKDQSSPPQLPHSPDHVGKIDTNISQPSSVFPSPLPGNITDGGAHSGGMPSPTITSVAQSTLGSFISACQASSSPRIVSQSASLDSSAVAEYRQFALNSERATSKPSQSLQSQAPSSSLRVVRPKFSWEE